MKLSVAYSGVVKVIDSVTGKVELRSLRSGDSFNGNESGKMDFRVESGCGGRSTIPKNTGSN